jgi:hypothetical protein
MIGSNIKVDELIFGFPNPKNYCFINVILQIIIRLPNIKQILNRVSVKNDKNHIEYLFYMISKLSLFKKKSLRDRTHKKIISFLKKFIISMDLEIDNDAKIFYREILNVFKLFPNSKVSEIVSIFEGIFENVIYCRKCNFCEKYQENFKDLNLGKFH